MSDRSSETEAVQLWEHGWSTVRLGKHVGAGLPTSPIP
jgi:hypothetical protein